jgi:hypothetical protein
MPKMPKQLNLTIIFLEAQGELAAPLFFMYLIGLAAIFKI